MISIGKTRFHRDVLLLSSTTLTVEVFWKKISKPGLTMIITKRRQRYQYNRSNQTEQINIENLDLILAEREFRLHWIVVLPAYRVQFMFTRKIERSIKLNVSLSVYMKIYVCGCVNNASSCIIQCKIFHVNVVMSRWILFFLLFRSSSVCPKFKWRSSLQYTENYPWFFS